MQTCEIVRICKLFQVVRIYELAQEIWRSHYTDILGEEQVEYMLAHFQSPKAIEEQIKEGYSYYMLTTPDEQDFGYMSFKEMDDHLFLSKLYFLPQFRGNGYAHNVIDFLKSMCEEKGLKKIVLNVNKNNSGSIKAYEKLGFEITDSKVTDIGGGFVMDDYVMTMTL